MTTLQTTYEELISPPKRRSGVKSMSPPVSAGKGNRSTRLFERVVIPLGLVADPEPLLGQAADLAARFHAEILLLQLIPAASALLRAPGQAAHLQGSLSQTAHRLIRAGAVRVHAALLEGNASHHIEDVARQHQATLILLSEERDDSHPPHWFGTVTQRLSRGGCAPLLVVRPDCAMTMAPVLCAVDFSDSSRAAFIHALELAGALACRLTVLNVVPMPVSLREEAPIWRSNQAAVLPVHSGAPAHSAWHAVEVERKMDEARRELTSFVREFDLSGVECETVVACGSLVAETLSAARARKAGLIVVGAGPRYGSAIVESQTPAAAIAEIADVPVLISQPCGSSVEINPQVSLFARKTR
jgi:nucleotide-binding universal stress UspA family protein